MAQDINHFFCVGRLTKDLGSDPNGRDFGYLQNGTCKGTISIAVNNAKKQGDQWVEEVSYFNIVIWGKTAENLKPYLTKGQQVVIDAHLKQDRWTDQQGNNRSQITIVADNVELVGGKRDNQQNGYENGYSQPQSQYAQQYQNQQNQNPFAQQNNMTQVQQMAGQPMQTRQPQQMPQQQGGFKEDIPWDNQSDIPF